MNDNEIADKIDEWHLDYTGPLELWEFMGWTREQYKNYVETGTIPNEEV